MKELHIKIIELLSDVSKLNWIDMDKGQLDFYSQRPNVNFPAALVNINIPDVANEDNYYQRVRARVLIRVAMKYTGESSAAAPKSIRENSLDFYSLLDDIHKKLQGYADDNYDPISRVGVQNHIRQDGFIETTIAYDVWYDDETATR